MPIGTYYLMLKVDNWCSTMKVSCMATTAFGWAEFAAKSQERFYLDELHWQKQEEFIALSQGTRSVQEYSYRFIV